MTHDEMIAVIQADKEGKKVQFRNLHGDDIYRWKDNPDGVHLFDFLDYEYRIKQEPKKPREWVLATDFSGKIIASNVYSVGAIIEIPGSPLEVGEVIRVREVLE